MHKIEGKHSKKDSKHSADKTKQKTTEAQVFKEESDNTDSGTRKRLGQGRHEPDDKQPQMDILHRFSSTEGGCLDKHCFSSRRKSLLQTSGLLLAPGTRLFLSEAARV